MDCRVGAVMKPERLYVIMLHTADGSTPQRVCYIDESSGIPVLRETMNCWYIAGPPHGLPERFRKAEEYKLLNNKFGIYIFGRDSVKLAKEWNSSTSVQI